MTRQFNFCGSSAVTYLMGDIRWWAGGAAVAASGEIAKSAGCSMMRGWLTWDYPVSI